MDEHIVFIGGSRRITWISPDVKTHLDRIVESGLPVLVGDANGADKAVQKYLAACEYHNVSVFYSSDKPRNNIGDWYAEHVQGGKRGFAMHTAKDEEMAKRASTGLVLWDGKSKGTLLQARRLATQGKKVDVYVSHSDLIGTIDNDADFRNFVAEHAVDSDAVAEILSAYPSDKLQSKQASFLP